MKAKILLATALCMGGAVALTAQNLVKNGGFEATDYVDELDGTTHEVYSWDRNSTESGGAQNGLYTVYVPGWDRASTNGVVNPINYDYEKELTAGTENPEPWSCYNVPDNNKWNGYIGLVEQTSEPDYDPSSWYYLNIRRVDNDGWGAEAGISQTMAVEAGQLYHISFVYSLPALIDQLGTAPLSRRIEVLDVADNSVLYEFPIEDTASDVEWTTVEGQFTAGDATSQVVLRATLKGSWKNEIGNGHNNGTELNVDNFKVWKDGTSPDDPNAVADVLADNVQVLSTDGFIRIQGAEAGDVLSVYNMAGQQVVNMAVTSADFTVDARLAGGIYVVKINDATRKVAL